MKIPAFKMPVADAIERGACGVGFVADQHGRASAEILQLGLSGLVNLQHRGGLDADNKTGDGAGVLTPIPGAFFSAALAELTGQQAAPERIAVGMFFFRPAHLEPAAAAVGHALAAHGVPLAAWRKPPINPDVLGPQARARIPLIRQALIVRPAHLAAAEFEQRLYLARKAFERESAANGWSAYVASLSGRTVVYKGLLHAPQVGSFYLDLAHPHYAVSSVVFHQRYSTNTLPTWERAQPFRLLCHNGEINTIQGNVAWVQARTAQLAAAGGFTPAALQPVIDASGSDSAMLDNYAELLWQTGRHLPHVLSMLLPMAWEKLPDLPAAVRDFYAYHAHLAEPWDGPAAIVFSDGRVVGATLDRNGLRPLRYAATRDGLVYAASEIGAVTLDAGQLTCLGKLGPGQMLAVDTQRGQLLGDAEIKAQLAARQPYGQWLCNWQLPAAGAGSTAATPAALSTELLAFGYTHDDVVFTLRPMAEDGIEPVGSMGDDTPPAVMSAKPRPLFHYFRQRFAEVTNPPIDPLREGLVMSLQVRLGARANALCETPEHTRHLQLPSPLLDDAQLQQLRQQPHLPVQTLSTLWLAAGGSAALQAALDALCSAARSAVAGGCQLLILSDRGVDAQHSLLPALLALGAVHHHLIRADLRGRTSLVVDSGEPRSVHDVAALVGYGASAVCPYLALAAVPTLVKQQPELAPAHYIKAMEKGLLKVMSKMGISTVEAYCGAQIFECIGLHADLVDAHFSGTPAHLGGSTLADVARIPLAWHALAFGPEPAMPSPGYYKFKRGGELHAFEPEMVKRLHRAVRTPGANNGHFADGYSLFREFVAEMQARPPIAIRDLLAARPLAHAPIQLETVEARPAIMRRFSVAAMSHGAISSEAHETLALAMNALGASSNSGEGGEDPARYGTARNSRAKQVASARFGMTPAYLLSADELQIKMAQGAKPGEGGQLPGHKVTAEIAAIRHAPVGAPLISPPPHHDIYSIEDLAQLIFDLRQINPRAAISVKLVAQAGVGTIASGVAKAGADVIVISGHSGGTGAAAWSSIKHAGLPWELGLAEAQRVLINSGLRGRVRLRADGGLYTGRDVFIAALLGADEFSFGTSALIAAGCVMARTCHTNNCPVGVATQRADLRAKFAGTPEQVMAFMNFVAQDLREHMAALGVATVAELIGRTPLLHQVLPGCVGEPAVDLSTLLHPPGGGVGRDYSHSGAPNPSARLDAHNRQLLDEAQALLQTRSTPAPLALAYQLTNASRTFGATLSGAIVAKHGSAGLPDGTLRVTCSGVAGQSFGAHLAPGMQLLLHGPANDYVGKGLDGGRIIICPPAGYTGAHPVLAGNTLLYGALSGELFIAGLAGERFAVRNSGACAVVEGVGDHGCEYMTGGVVVILGQTGYNFGAGMTGGVAYVHDVHKQLGFRLNEELVTTRPLTRADHTQLREWVERHAGLTGSPRAGKLLADWPAALAHFVCIAPRWQLAQTSAAETAAADAALPAGTPAG